MDASLASTQDDDSAVNTPRTTDYSDLKDKNTQGDSPQIESPSLSEGDDHAVDHAVDHSDAFADKVDNTYENTSAVVIEEDVSSEVSRYRLAGNAALRDNDVEKGLELYGKALKLDPNNYIILSNRSAAFSRLGQFEKSVEEAKRCVAVAPEFLKGHGRLATGLARCEKWEEAIVAAEEGLKKAMVQLEDEASWSSNASVSLLSEVWCKGRAKLIEEALNGCWLGTVAPEMGEYEQFMRFESGGRVLLSVMDTDIPSEYSIAVSPPTRDVDFEKVNPMFNMDLKAVNGPPESAVFFIARLWHSEASKIYYTGRTSSNIQLILEICAPFASDERPKEFEGPGVVLMYKVDGRPLHPEPSEDIMKLSFEEQLEMYFRDICEITPEINIEEETRYPPISAEDGSRRMGLVMRCQAKLFKLAQKYPAEVSQYAEQLLLQKDIPAGTNVPKGCEAARKHVLATGMSALQFARQILYSRPVESPVSSMDSKSTEPAQNEKHCCTKKVVSWVNENRCTLAVVSGAALAAAVAYFVFQQRKSRC